jgi:hypothetical protein
MKVMSLQNNYLGMNGEQLIGKDWEGNGRGIIGYHPGIFLNEMRKVAKKIHSG